MPHVTAYGAQSATDPITPLTIERRTPTDTDVEIAIDYCGVCHSDIHISRSEWPGTLYPVVPGHEIVGHVTAVGDGVKKYKVGDHVAVGCFVGSCRQCADCGEDLEQYCPEKVTTYSAEDPVHGGITQGGYSKSIVVDEHFVLKMPDNLEPHAVAPILCAGITMWSPLRHWHVKAGDVVGIIGLGGLGHMGVKLAHALGAKVIMITRSASKGEDAKKLGADDVLLSSDDSQMQAHKRQFDLLINTIPASHDMNPYLPLLKRDGTMVVVGSMETNEPGVNTAPLIVDRTQIAGSLVGGIKETQALLDFCGKHNIVSDVEMINIDQINDAYQRMINGDVKYRFVIDMKSLT